MAVECTVAVDRSGTVANITTRNLSGNVVPRPLADCVVLSVKPGAFIPWDNPDNLVSREMEVAVDTAVAVVVLPVLFFISAPTNVLNMIVFWKQGLKERINLCLFSLSLVDSLYMLHSFVYNIDKIYFQFTKASGVGAVFEFVVNNHLMFMRGFNWVSGFITMVIACERCFCVFSPLRSQTVLKTKTTGAILAVATILLLGIMHISTSRWSTACVFDPVTNTTSKTIYPSRFYLENQKMIDIVTGLVISLLVPGIYISVVSITTILIFVRLRRMAAWREQTSSAGIMSSRELALTRMLIGITVMYVICSTPVLALGVCLLFVPDMSLQGRYYNAFNLMVSFLELFSYVNASFNFFVYCFLGTKYKETLKELCLQCCCCGMATRRERPGKTNTETPIAKS